MQWTIRAGCFRMECFPAVENAARVIRANEVCITAVENTAGRTTDSPPRRMGPTTSTSLDSTLADLRLRVDSALDHYTDLDSGCPDDLREAMRYSLLSPGKRLRPLLTLLAAEACGGQVDRALPAACAMEMVHAYSLIHDDLPAMDDDDLRRGRPTCHKAFNEGVAILAGDALLTLAFGVLSRDIPSAEIAVECCALLAQAAGATQLVGGQADDLAGESYSGNIDRLQHIHARKTGAMIVCSLESGAVVAGASNKQRQTVIEYGRGLGLAFQITDDLLDVRGDCAAMGKRSGKDLDRGKLTFPGVLGVEESERRAKELVAAACRSIASFGSAGASLDALARRVLERTH